MDLTDLEALPDPYPVTPLEGPLDAVVRVPGSKSITNRALICAALAEGTSTLEGVLVADDTEAMVGAVGALGLDVALDRAAARASVVGCGGRVPATDAVIDVRQSGTTARFVTPVLAALGSGAYRVTGHPQLLARPMGPTLDGLRALGAAVEEVGPPGHLPALVRGGGVRGGEVRLAGDVSSQHLSGLLLAAPLMPDGLVVHLTTDLVSRPYVDLTIAVMAEFGVEVGQPDGSTFEVAPSTYRATRFVVEPDASAASYGWGAAAVAGGRVRVAGLRRGAAQGDVALVDLLAAMGAEVVDDPEGLVVAVEGPLRGGHFDLRHISDTAQTLAVVAAGATGRTVLDGIGFIRRKETDRVTAVVAELRRCGVGAEELADGLAVDPAPVAPAVVQTYEDHRMAMAFALLGLAHPGIRIADPGCVAKTFPGFWAMLASLGSGGNEPRG